MPALAVARPATRSAARTAVVAVAEAYGYVAPTDEPVHLGDKSRATSEADRVRVVRIYDAIAEQAPEDVDDSRVIQTTDFGYWTTTAAGLVATLR